MKPTLKLLTTLLLAPLVLHAQQPRVIEADLCIYGGTSGGVAAAVHAARMGKSVVIAEPGKHLGGMTSGGLIAVDIGDPRSVGGIAREYFTRLVADDPRSRPSVGPLFHESQVWAADEAELKAHHVFGLCRSEKGTVLAVCEGRIKPDDIDPHHLLLKRSTDRGATWGKDIFVERSRGQECFANPTPLVDRRTGRIFLFYALNFGNQRSQIFYRTSDDDGVTWSDRTEVPRLFDGDPLKRPFHLPGPGHGVQLHSGRLVVPMWHRLAISRDNKSPPWEKRLYAASVITSDDGGKTWRAGECTPTEFHANESRVVELSDGQLLLNSRSTGFLDDGIKRRVEARSRDAGATWASSGWAETFPSFTPCDAAFIRLYHGPAKDKDWLVFSWPDNLTKRVDMTVALSTDGGRTWAARRQVAPLSGYSDLVELDDGSIGLLYGIGWSAVRFARFGLDWLKGGQPQPGKQAISTGATGPRGAAFGQILLGRTEDDLKAAQPVKP